HRNRLMNAFLNLKPWPDVFAALKALTSAGVRLGILSNFTTHMLQSGIEASGLHGAFQYVLSTDQVQTFKPDPRAYQMGVASSGLSRDQIAFVPFASWAAAGAKWFGYPVYWANRGHQPSEMGVVPEVDAADLSGLLKFLRS